MNNSNRKKLFIVRRESSGIGGAEKVAHRFVKSFSKYFETELIHAGRIMDGVKIKGTYGPSWLKCVGFASSARKFIKTKPDALVFSMERGVPGTIYRAGDGVHIKWLQLKYTKNSVKRVLNPINHILPILEKISIEESKFVIANSKFIKKQLHNYYPKIPQNKVSVIYNGYDTAIFRQLKEEEKSELRQKWNVTKDNLNILFSGSGWERKGLDLVLDIASKLSRQDLAVKVRVAGRGNSEKYKSTAQRLGLSNKIEFLGPVKNIQELYQISDCMILPTKYDAFSNSCIEALACGCHVITTNQNGASELINESNGLVMNYNEPVFFEKVVLHLLSFAKKKRKNEYRDYESTFGHESETQQYHDLLNSA